MRSLSLPIIKEGPRPTLTSKLRLSRHALSKRANLSNTPVPPGVNEAISVKDSHTDKLLFKASKSRIEPNQEGSPFGPLLDKILNFISSKGCANVLK